MSHFSWLIFFLPILLHAAPAPESLHQKIDALNLGLDPHWLKLGHYKKNIWGNYQSEADGERFFQHPEGKTNPPQELHATLDGFFSSVPHSEESPHPQCTYPARKRWLVKKLALSPTDFPKIVCPAYESYVKRVAAKSASLVFSSYYLNNPSSVFGHTLIRLGKDPKGTGGTAGTKLSNELLDFGINYAANVTTKNALLYAILGTIGGFQGTFTNLPYYYKIRQYNDYEARDLWSYNLNLTQEEIDFLVAHLWELGATYFDYFYFTENCAYHILGALDAIRPETNFLTSSSYWVIPGDTVMTLQKAPGWVKGISYRPSIRSQFMKRFERLSDREKTAFYEIESTSDLSVLKVFDSDHSRMRILDAAIDYFDYKNSGLLLASKEEQNLNLDKINYRQALLTLRSKIDSKSELVFETPENEYPHLAHPSLRWGLETGYEKNPSFESPFNRLALRFALHDLLDPSDGYPKYAQVEFMHLQAKFFWQRAPYLELDQASLFRITSLNPIGIENKGLSWRVNLGAKRFLDENCDRCFGPEIAVGGGMTLNPFGGVFYPYLLMDLENHYASTFLASDYRLSVGPSLGGVFHLSPRFKAFFEGRYRYLVFSQATEFYQAMSEIRYAPNRRWSFGVKAGAWPDAKEISLTSFVYF